MLAGEVECMVFIGLNRHLIDEVRETDAAVEQARTRVAKSAQNPVPALEKSANMAVDLKL